MLPLRKGKNMSFIANGQCHRSPIFTALPRHNNSWGHWLMRTVFFDMKWKEMLFWWVLWGGWYISRDADERKKCRNLRYWWVTPGNHLCLLTFWIPSIYVLMEKKTCEMLNSYRTSNKNGVLMITAFLIRQKWQLSDGISHFCPLISLNQHVNANNFTSFHLPMTARLNFE